MVSDVSGVAGGAVIDADLAKAWGKLTGRAIELHDFHAGRMWGYEDAREVATNGGYVWLTHSPVPDPAEQPQAWLSALLVSGRSVRIRPCGDGHLHFEIDGHEWVEYLGWENLGPATEAAIRAWAKA